MSYLDFGVIVVHDIVVVISLLLVDLKEGSYLLSGELLALVTCGLVVHHLVELGQCLGVVFV